MKDSYIHEKMSSDVYGFEDVKLMGLINVTIVFPQTYSHSVY